MKNALKHPLFWLGTVLIVLAIAVPFIGVTQHEQDPLVSKAEKFMNKPTKWNLRGLVTDEDFEKFVGEGDIEKAQSDAENYSFQIYSGTTVTDEENGEAQDGYINVFIVFNKKKADSSSSPDIRRSQMFFKTIDGKRFWDIFH